MSERIYPVGAGHMVINLSDASQSSMLDALLDGTSEQNVFINSSSVVYARELIVLDVKFHFPTVLVIFKLEDGVIPRKIESVSVGERPVPAPKVRASFEEVDKSVREGMKSAESAKKTTIR